MKDARALRIGFVGAGRVAGGLSMALHEAGLPVTAIASRSHASAKAVADRIGGTAFESAQDVADQCDLVFITTPDGAISTTTDAIQWRAGQAVVHCSGATEVSTLATAEKAGAMIGGFHPMQSFGDPATSARALNGSTITIEAGEPLDGVLSELAAALGCRINRLLAGKRPLYHASAGYGSQFVNVLLSETATIWRDWGASEEDVIRAILPMIRGTLDAIEKDGIAGGMPGPVSRGDEATVAAHVDALRLMGPDRLAFYRAHCARTVDLAEEAERIDRDTANRIRNILSE